jgi:hypothetical protein
MQMFKSEKEFGTVKARDSRVDVRALEGRRYILPRSLLIKSMLSLQMVEQFSSVDKAGQYGLVKAFTEKRKYLRKNQVQLLLRLETEFQRDYERAVNLCQNKTFREGMRNFVTVDDVDFPDGFKSVNTSCISFPNLHNLHHEALGSVKTQ